MTSFPSLFGNGADKHRLGIFYNAIPGQNRKDLVEEWGKGMYGDAWAELEKLGQTEHEEGFRLFDIEREWKA